MSQSAVQLLIVLQTANEHLQQQMYQSTAVQ